MKKLTTQQLREQYIEYFKTKNHAVIPSASLIPENDPTVLFTTAGMHPLVPYLMGERHPSGNRLVNVQKCVRTGDIDDVGDATHCTFFEMLGNWSLGDYFKKESIEFSFEFLTKVLNIPLEKLAVTVFLGDADSSKDDFSAKCWQDLGIFEQNIFYLPKKYNWWGPAGTTGPCGPDTEIFIITDAEKCSDNCSPACDCGRYVEIWNNVFMEFDKKEDGSYVPLSQKNVDTGMGLERTVAMLNNYKSVYETDVFAPIMALLKEKSGSDNIKAMRIIADHIRTATFMLGDEKGVVPSNVDQGYILRRLIRRAVRFVKMLEIDSAVIEQIALLYIEIYGAHYKELVENKQKIIEELNLEIDRFNKTLVTGLKEFEKLIGYIQNNRMSGKAAFRLYDTFGFPIEMTMELASDKGISVDLEGFEDAFKAHQKKSQAGAEQKFKGGLADSGEATARLHTATHILNASLKKVLNDQTIQQRGSNITAERLRFDFNFSRPLTKEEIALVEQDVNAVIAQNFPIVCEEMSIEQAKQQGAIGMFSDKYDANVKVYSIGGHSKELCGGPHASSTGELGQFVIAKEQSSSSGIRRIKAILKTD